VGGVGLAVGTVFGIMALASKSSLNGECPTKTTCPKAAQSDIDALGSRATISTVGFGVGIAGVALGAVLLATSSGAEPPSTGISRPTPRRPWSPWIALGAAGVEGRFE
jgi:hypothetical protein